MRSVKDRTLSLTGLILAVICLAGGLVLLASAYRRVQGPLDLAGEGLVVEGVVTEKLVEARPDRLLPFDVTTYIVRYAYPNVQGQMRSGEQPVTRRFYDRLSGQGSPARILFDPANPARSAIDPRLTFPGAAGWRAGMGVAGLLLAIVFSTLSTALSRRAAAAGK